jgi:hypothetical protein
MLWTGLVWLRIGTGENCCKLGNEPSGSEMLGTAELLHKLWPLERYSAPQSYLVSSQKRAVRYCLIFLAKGHDDEVLK